MLLSVYFFYGCISTRQMNNHCSVIWANKSGWLISEIRHLKWGLVCTVIAAVVSMLLLSKCDDSHTLCLFAFMLIYETRKIQFEKPVSWLSLIWNYQWSHHPSPCTSRLQFNRDSQLFQPDCQCHMWIMIFLRMLQFQYRFKLCFSISSLMFTRLRLSHSLSFDYLNIFEFQSHPKIKRSKATKFTQQSREQRASK